MGMRNDKEKLSKQNKNMCVCALEWGDWKCVTRAWKGPRVVGLEVWGLLEAEATASVVSC